MKITALAENTSISPQYQHQHGLSLFIEANGQKILFDFGADDLFYRNSQQLNLNLEEVDLAVLSHGHNDHSGGIKTFLAHNSHAPLYVKLNAFRPYFAQHGEKCNYIGIEPELLPTKRFIFTEDMTIINHHLLLFSDIKAKHPLPSGNKILLQTLEGQCPDLSHQPQSQQLIADDFTHEQNLLIQEDNHYLLIAGCAHRGILNIMTRATEILGKAPDFVIAGFHLSSPDNQVFETTDTIQELATQLSAYNSRYFTCHCTGTTAFQLLQHNMQQQINYLATGQTINLTD